MNYFEVLLMLPTGRAADKHVCHERFILIFLQVFLLSAEIQAFK